jgi:hypothetical protein
MFKPDGKVSKGTTKTVDGVETIGLVDDGADGGTLYVATVGEPYPIRVEPSNADDGAMAFSSFGKSFPELKLPAAGDVIDLQKLAQG